MRPIMSSAYENQQQYAHYQWQSDVFSAAFVSSRGGRKENQDCFGAVQAHDGSCILSVADGLGGHAGGRLASQTAITAINDFMRNGNYCFEQPHSLLAAFAAANTAIIEQQQQQPRYGNMRSTLVVLAIKNSLAFWGHVGDVRLYHLRNNRIRFQTRDHSVPQMLADSGDINPEDIRNHPDRSSLLNSLGNSGRLKVSIPQQYLNLAQGDQFHLSTDGFWEWITETTIEKLFAQNQPMAQTTAKMEQTVIASALKKEPRHDNFTALNIYLHKAQRNEKNWRKTCFIDLNKSPEDK